MEIRALLQRVVAMEASDLHLKVGRVPVVRVSGRLRALDGTELTRSRPRRWSRS